MAARYEVTWATDQQPHQQFQVVHITGIGLDTHSNKTWTRNCKYILLQTFFFKYDTTAVLDMHAKVCSQALSLATSMWSYIFKFQ